jgi:hypothetical protein
LAQNRALVAPVISPTDEQNRESLKQKCAEILEQSPKSSTAAVVAYWTAVKQGIFKYEK